MHKLVSNGDFCRGTPNLKRMKYFHLLFCHNHSLTKPSICAKNQRFELYHLLPGFLIDTLFLMLVFFIVRYPCKLFFFFHLFQRRSPITDVPRTTRCIQHLSLVVDRLVLRAICLKNRFMVESMGNESSEWITMSCYTVGSHFIGKYTT